MIDGLPGCLSHNVPERNIHRGNGFEQHAAGLAGDGAEHALPPRP
jgi:hypothetical protein